MNPIQIREVDSARDLKMFIRLPWSVYRGDPHWVPPLIMDMKTLLNREKNPFFEHSDAALFLAFKDGRPIGRIAAILNRNHNAFHEENIGFFGFFECFENAAASAALFDAAEAWCRTHGAEAIRGPANFSTNDTCGMLAEGFDAPPVVMMAYNPEYYNRLVRDAGYEKCEDLLAYRKYTSSGMTARVRKVSEAARRNERITVRNMRMRDFWQEVDVIKRIYNDAWSRNWGFVPMTDSEFHHLAKELKPVVDPDFVFIAELDGEPIGFSLSLPDYNQALIRINGRLFPFGLPKLLYYSRKIDAVRVMILGIVKQHQNMRGLGSLLYEETYDQGARKNITWGEFSWILESNKLMNSAARIMGAEVYKRYRIYEKRL